VGWCRAGPPATVVMMLLLAGCSDTSGPTAPSPPTTSTPLPTEQSGPVAITFAGATPPPGSTVTGCGTNVRGCENLVAMRFTLRAQAPGPVLGVRVFLHATNLLACLQATHGPFDLSAGEVREVAVVFDRSDDRCPVPLDIANMALVIEGPGQVASRQTWSITYTFVP
jgi:hypothetical protein